MVVDVVKAGLRGDSAVRTDVVTGPAGARKLAGDSAIEGAGPHPAALIHPGADTAARIVAPAANTVALFLTAHGFPFAVETNPGDLARADPSQSP